jgi:hypothetical protein
MISFMLQILRPWEVVVVVVIIIVIVMEGVSAIYVSLINAAYSTDSFMVIVLH